MFAWTAPSVSAWIMTVVCQEQKGSMMHSKTSQRKGQSEWLKSVLKQQPGTHMNVETVFAFCNPPVRSPCSVQKILSKVYLKLIWGGLSLSN